jgi:hypothetical protein
VVTSPPNKPLLASAFYSSVSGLGDYSTIVVDPSDGKTFWSANEYIGSDGDSNIWRTHITSFRAR